MKLPPNRSCWPWPISGLCFSYAISIATFFILRSVLVSWPPFLALLNNFVPFLFIPLPFALLLAWLARARLALLSSLIILLLFLLLYGSFFLPRFYPMTPPGDRLTVMSFNIGDLRSDPETLAAVIEAEAADIVAIEELNYRMAKPLQDRLSRRYSHRLFGTDVGPTGLLSRFPILSYNWFQPLLQGRSGLHAVVEVNGKPLHVIVIHLYSPSVSWSGAQLSLPVGLRYEDQSPSVNQIMQYIATLNGPILLLGDFNMSDQNRAYTQLTRLVQDAYREAGWGFGFTFPNNLQIRSIPLPAPVVRIDYIFHSAHIYANRAYVGCNGGSDHCYVVAQLIYPASER
jgi:endonuclease/exonuclease/phosphatase (EEP) superfamily protein YafD